MGSGLFGRVEQELGAREKSPGLNMSDVITLPNPLRRLINWMIRERQVELTAAAAYMGQDEAAVHSMLAEMVDRGEVVEFDLRGQTFFRVRLAPKRGREIPLDIWQSLDEKCEE